MGGGKIVLVAGIKFFETKTGALKTQITFYTYFDIFLDRFWRKSE
jgi:hypothetical protein